MKPEKSKAEKRTKLIVAITGASGANYAVALLRALKEKGIEVHLVVSEWAEETLKLETGMKTNDLKKIVHRAYANDDLAAPIASSSFLCDGMIVMPCTLKTASEIANAHCGTLISRAADNTLKMRGRLVVGVRETPLSTPALEQLHKISIAGGIVMPLCPAFYHKPKEIKDLEAFIVGKALDCLGIGNSEFGRWGEGSRKEK
ncbi:Flavin prenyltransferase UbiX [uncultured archaeon]|nr:Flavin prenyltransferase UbiX [uncultured archaeon]